MKTLIEEQGAEIVTKTTFFRYISIFPFQRRNTWLKIA
jgi:hypothetical protein